MLFWFLLSSLCMKSLSFFGRNHLVSTAINRVNHCHRLTMVSTSSSASATTSTKRFQEFQQLLVEVTKIAINTGPIIGVTRTAQLASAGIKVTDEFLKDPNKYLNKDRLPSIPKIMRRLFEELGATYIKLGQFIASSPTLFPADYVLEFQGCLDNSPTVPYSVVKQIIEEELGKAVSSAFSYIDPMPIASASIAQVHKAKLINGTDVCIKIQKPGVDSTLIADLNFLTVATKILEFSNPSLSRLSLANIVSDIKDSMFEELDFRKEAKNLINFREFLVRNNIEDAVAPMPYLDVSSKRILTMEYLNGVPLVDLEGIRRYTVSPEATLISALRTWGLSVTENDRFHADVHGGNLLVLEDGRVGFIDFGIVGRIPERVWGALNGLVEGLVEGDFRRVASSLVQMGATGGSVDLDKFAEEVQSVFNKIAAFQPQVQITAYEGSVGQQVTAQLTVDERETTELVLELVAVADKNGLRLPREFGFLLKQALYFDRYQKLLAPDIDPLRDVRVRESFRSLNTPDSVASPSPNKGRRGGTIIDAEIVG